MKYVKEGNKMKRPDDCPDILFDLMSECWHIVPDERPTFLQICQRLVGDANERFRRTSFFLTPEGREAVINQEEMLQVGGWSDELAEFQIDVSVSARAGGGEEPGPQHSSHCGPERERPPPA